MLSKTHNVIFEFVAKAALAVAAGLAVLLAATPLLAAAHSFTKEQAIQRLVQLQSKQRQAVQESDRKIQKTLQESTAITLKDLADSAVGFTFSSIREQTERSLGDKDEFVKRIRFIDQLILQVESKFSGGDVRAFLSQAMLDLAISEVGAGTFETPKDLSQTLFLVYASVALREIPEPFEDPFAFFEAYLSFSGVSDPKSPQEFFLSKNYSNGTQFDSSEGQPIEETDKENRLPEELSYETPETKPEPLTTQ